MQVTLNHRYAEQVQVSFTLGRGAPARNPIGVKVNEETITEKPEALKQYLGGYDLRNITPKQLAAIGTRLLSLGEISDTTAGDFIIGNEDLAVRDTPFDAVTYFEKKYSDVQSYISNGIQGLDNSLVYSSDTLAELYNLDTFIHSSRSQLNFNTKA